MNPQAYKCPNDPHIYDWDTGQPLPANWAGTLTVLFKDGPPALFKTHLDPYGEREWVCIKAEWRNS
jgi:hypothetical protein